MWGGCLEGVERLSFGCGKAVKRVRGGCLEGIEKLSGAVGRLSGGCEKAV